MIGFKIKTKEAEAKVETRPSTITKLDDKRLIKINPQEEDFYDVVLNFKTENEDINLFIDAVEEVKDANLEAFYKPIYDPSIGKEQIIFQKGEHPSVNWSYFQCISFLKTMSEVEGRRWKLATEYQYYCFLVWLINQLHKTGKTLEDAINSVVIDSKKLEQHYEILVEEACEWDYKPTGSTGICGVYDLTTTSKILASSDPKADFFLFTGCSINNKFSLADICDFPKGNDVIARSVPMFVL